MAMQMDPVQAVAAAKLVPFALFCIGAAALFFVLRRSITRFAQSAEQQDTALHSRTEEAQLRIEQIAAREWLRKHQRAAKARRTGAPPDAALQAVLARISAYQRRRTAA